LDETALARLLGHTQDPRQAVDALVEAAIAADGHDNTTALAAFFSASDSS
jgi:serine/threonine protein phosphatase PrpC